MCYLYFFCLHCCLINIHIFDYPDSRLSGLFTEVPTSPDNRGSTVIWNNCQNQERKQFAFLERKIENFSAHALRKKKKRAKKKTKTKTKTHPLRLIKQSEWPPETMHCFAIVL